MTYPDERVAGFLGEHYACLKLNAAERSDDLVKVLGSERLRWTPTFLWHDHALRELRRTIGFLDPEAFLAELRLALAFAALQRARNETALERFREVAELHPESHVAAEALYFAGVAAFYSTRGDKEVLRREWETLWARFPQHTWTVRSTVFPEQVAARGSPPRSSE